MALELHRRTAVAIMTLGLAAPLVACGGATESDLFGTPPGVDAGADVGSNDAARDARKDNDVPDSPPPAQPIIACGPPLNNPQAKCDATKKEYCCRRGDADPFKFNCETDVTACADPNDVSIYCSSTNTCAALGLVGSVCCGSLVGNGGGGSIITGTSCTSPANCVSGGSIGKTILCDPGAPNNCPNGGTCKLSAQTMPGYYLCI